MPSLSADSSGLGDGGESWRDSDGDRLDDFGVDECAEFCDEDDIPLAELVRRRHESSNCNDGSEERDISLNENGAVNRVGYENEGA